MQSLPKVLAVDDRSSAVLNRLYADALRGDPQARETARNSGIGSEDAVGFYEAMDTAYMPVTPELGKLLYALVRISQAKAIEYGSSLGISTIHLAAGLRDNGGGRLIACELSSGKVRRARENLAAAGLQELVEFRAGDARQTLAADLPVSIDCLILDGKKAEYLDILLRVGPHLRPGAIVVADNIEMAGAVRFREHLDRSDSAYAVSQVFTMALGDYHAASVMVKLR